MLLDRCQAGIAASVPNMAAEAFCEEEKIHTHDTVVQDKIDETSELKICKQNNKTHKHPETFEVGFGESMPEKSTQNLQEAFRKFQKQRKDDIRQTKRRLRQQRRAKRDPQRMDSLRQRLLEQTKRYFGVPYARKYWNKDSVEYQSPLFLDCCGLIRQVMRDLQNDFGFRIGPWNQAYMFDTLPIVLREDQMKPGDLVFMTGTSINPKSRKQRHSMMHVEIWLGEGTKTIGARWNNGKVQVFDSYRFRPKSFTNERYHFRSIDTWLMGICKSYCDRHRWGLSAYDPNKNSIFFPEQNLTQQDQKAGDESDTEDIQRRQSGSGNDQDNDEDKKRSCSSSQAGSQTSQGQQAAKKKKKKKKKTRWKKGRKVVAKNCYLPQITKSALQKLEDRIDSLAAHKADVAGVATQQCPVQMAGDSKRKKRLRPANSVDLIYAIRAADSCPQTREKTGRGDVPQSGSQADTERSGFSEIPSGPTAGGRLTRAGLKKNKSCNDLEVTSTRRPTHGSERPTLQETTEAGGELEPKAFVLKLWHHHSAPENLQNLRTNSNTVQLMVPARQDLRASSVLPTTSSSNSSEEEEEVFETCSDGETSVACSSDCCCLSDLEGMDSEENELDEVKERDVRAGLVWGQVDTDQELEALSSWDRIWADAREEIWDEAVSPLQTFPCKPELGLCGSQYFPSLKSDAGPTFSRADTLPPSSGSQISISSLGNVSPDLLDGSRFPRQFQFLTDNQNNNSSWSETSLCYRDIRCRPRPSVSSAASISLRPVENITGQGGKEFVVGPSAALRMTKKTSVSFNLETTTSSTSTPSDGDGKSGGSSGGEPGSEWESAGGEESLGPDSGTTDSHRKRPNRRGGKRTPGGRPTKLPACSLPSNMVPTFFVGGGNGVALVEAPLLAMGWKRTMDKHDERFRLKWVECKSKINYCSFREGDQLVNHIPNCKLLTNKLGLLCSLQEYERVTLSTKGRPPRLRLMEFFPETYKVDEKVDRATFLDVYKDGEIWICKPVGLNQGKGIFLLRSRDEIDTLLADREAKRETNRYSFRTPMTRIVQRYITNPLLLEGRKFDIRAYMLLASTVPYLILFHHGYVRLSCLKYSGSDTNLITHLTNQFVQKKDPNYKDVKEDTAWTMEKFNHYINSVYAADKGLEKDWVFNSLTKQMQKIMLHCFNSVKHRLQCKVGYFDLYGLDFMIDSDMKVWLIEINVNPALHCTCEALKEVIPGVVEETLHVCIEVFEKARRNQQLMPLQSLKTFQVLYCGSTSFNVVPRQSRSLSPSKGENSERTRQSQAANTQSQRYSPPRSLPRMSLSTTQVSPYLTPSQGSSAGGIKSSPPILPNISCSNNSLSLTANKNANSIASAADSKYTSVAAANKMTVTDPVAASDISTTLSPSRQRPFSVSSARDGSEDVRLKLIHVRKKSASSARKTRDMLERGN